MCLGFCVCGLSLASGISGLGWCGVFVFVVFSCGFSTSSWCLVWFGGSSVVWFCGFCMIGFLWLGCLVFGLLDVGLLGLMFGV